MSAKTTKPVSREIVFEKLTHSADIQHVEDMIEVMYMVLMMDGRFEAWLYTLRELLEQDAHRFYASDCESERIYVLKARQRQVTAMWVDALNATLDKAAEIGLEMQAEYEANKYHIHHGLSREFSGYDIVLVSAAQLKAVRKDIDEDTDITGMRAYAYAG